MHAEATIYTVAANCQDCYRCVRICPVKAIRINGGQARVEDELCLKCGACVRECPQRAKAISSGLEKVQALLRSGRPVAASVAPSFAALPDAGRLPSALRRLGFRHVSETAAGAKYITAAMLSAAAEGVCTACPAVVSYVEKYRPEMLGVLIPIVSPMIAHARILKARLGGGWAVVFIGPCAAKKAEAERPENAGAVDAVLTFAELGEWLEEEDIQIENCLESDFDQAGEIGAARLFPLPGGLLETGGLLAGGIGVAEVIHLSGADEVMALFADSEISRRYKYAEPLFCKGGCINGPALGGEDDPLRRRAKIIAYAQTAPVPESEPRTAAPAGTFFTAREDFFTAVTENQINKALERTGKLDPASRLNCGACGYKNCLDNASAVARGMAEPEMCMPYMRVLAQQRTDRIIETMPSGVMIVDGELNMIRMNPAFQKMFICGGDILGRRVSYLLDPEGFEKLLLREVELYESIQTRYGVRYHEIVYALREDNQYIGIYSDISHVRCNREQLDVIKAQTLRHAREFLSHQVRFAQEMADYLGKSTARSEEIARRLISLYDHSL